jgi:selT/selW/selH-like putative selenoprotein
VEAELKAKFPDSNIKLIRGKDGIFDVKCNGKLIYSNMKEHRFPNDGEVSALIGGKIT